MAARKRQILRSMDDIQQESELLPQDLESIPEIIPESPIEAYFIDVAFKHGIIDSMLDWQDDDEDYY